MVKYREWRSQECWLVFIFLFRFLVPIIAAIHYKEPSSEPKFVHPAKLLKPKRIHDGRDAERVLTGGPVQQNGPTKRKNKEVSPKVQVKKSKQEEEVIFVSETKKAGKSRKSEWNMPNTQSSWQLLGTTATSEKVQTTYFVQEPDTQDEVTVVSNGREETFKTVVVESDDEDIVGLDTDEEVSDEDVSDEELEDEEVEDEMEDEDETEIDEDEMRIHPDDIAQYIDDEAVEDEEVDDEDEVEDEEEVDDEEVGDEESVVSEMDAESDDEGFIAGKDREAHVISKKQDSRVFHSAEVDFDKFPFTDINSVVTASRAFGFMVSPCDVQTFFE